MMPGIGHGFYWNGAGGGPSDVVFREGNMYLSSAGTAVRGMIRFASALLIALLGK